MIKRARVESEETEEEEELAELEETEAFVPLHEDMFEDLALREASEAEASVFEILTGPTGASYVNYCRRQSGGPVPAHIMTEFVVPFLLGQAVPVGDQSIEFHVGLDLKTGKWAVVTGADPELEPTEKLPSWPRVEFSSEKWDVLECSDVHGGFCRFQEGQSEEEMGPVLWSFVFECAFPCAH